MYKRSRIGQSYYDLQSDKILNVEKMSFLFTLWIVYIREASANHML